MYTSYISMLEQPKQYCSMCCSLIYFTQLYLRYHLKKICLVVYQDLMRLKEVVAMKSVTIHCVMHLVLKMQDAYIALIQAYYWSLLLCSVDAVCCFYLLLLSTIQIGIYDKCCDCCPRFCSCEEFYEEYNTCCDAD